MTNPSGVTGIVFGSQDVLEKWPVTLGFASDDRLFSRRPLNPTSQTVSLVTLVISHYLYTVDLIMFTVCICDTFIFF